MADAAPISDDPPPHATVDYDFGLAIPPLDPTFFTQQLDNNDNAPGGYQNDVAFDDLDFDFSFDDDLWIPSPDDIDDLNSLLNPAQSQQLDSSTNFPDFAPNLDQIDAFIDSGLCGFSKDGDFPGDRSSDGSGVMSSASPGLETDQISGHLNALSPESNKSNSVTPENCGGYAKGLNCPSPESEVSGNCRSNVSEDSNTRAARSVSSSLNPDNKIRTGVTMLEEPARNNVNSSLLKRKKNEEDMLHSNKELMTSKYRKSNSAENSNDNNSIGELSEEDQKRKARLVRNRESAQLSRQRKKHYVDELEDKVKIMQSTIQDLNAKISYFMAENVTLRQQMGGGGAVPSPAMAPPPPGMYPPAAMMYPWMPCAPPYMMKPHGSQVPLVPIPRLKPQQPAQAPKISKKKEGPKIKKVAGVSFLGLLFFIMLFGGLVPMVNMRYGGESYVGGGNHEEHRGRVLMLNETDNGGKKCDGRKDFLDNGSVHCGVKPNGSQPLVASLYVPRNDKLVKIDGNLIIHSILASEKAMKSSHGKGGEETGLAVPGDLAPAIPGLPHLRAIGVGSADKDGMKPTATDGSLNQWFREGLTGPMLSSGMCTEVFQFDVSSASSSMLPSTTSRNITVEQNKNSTNLTKGRNRRILHGIPIPLPESSRNISEEHAKRNSQKPNLNGNNSATPMVVSVLVDPREAGDADLDGVFGKKSISRIFVVVLVDSVKYVTYSCMLPFLGSPPHLVTT